MLKLDWEQAHRRRLARHHLAPRAAPGALVDVVRDLGGLQAQVMNAAALQLWARVDSLSPDALPAALWDDRALVKTWAMRGTLHVLSADDLPLQVAARQTQTPRRPPSYFTYHKVTPEELEAIGVGVPAVLGAQPLTREQLADAVAEHAGAPRLAEVLRSGWGALLKPSAAQGDLCFGPSQGQNVTFVRPQSWLERWQAFDPQQAFQEVTRRYVNAYGPATPDDFARWWGVPPAAAKRAFRELGDALVAVNVAGWRAWALAESLDELRQPAGEASVHLLPSFDPYTLAFSRQPAVLSAQYLDRVSRAQGWIAPVVLVGGQIVGIWSHESQRTTTLVKVAMFSPPTSDVQEAIAREVDRLGTFLGTGVELDFSGE